MDSIEEGTKKLITLLLGESMVGDAFYYRSVYEALQAEHDAALERAANCCDNHSPGRSAPTRNPFQDDDEWEAMLACIRDEERGESIAAAMLAQEIRALKGEFK